MTTNPPVPGGIRKRAEPESLRGRTLSAALTVKELQRSVAWYRDVVGFTVDQEHEREGKIVAVSLKAGAVQMVLTQDDGARGMDRVKGAGMSLQITTAQSVDEIANRIKASGEKLLMEPTDMPWGARVLRFKDPDGFILVISTER